MTQNPIHLKREKDAFILEGTDKVCFAGRIFDPNNVGAIQWAIHTSIDRKEIKRSWWTRWIPFLPKFRWVATEHSEKALKFSYVEQTWRQAIPVTVFVHNIDEAGFLQFSELVIGLQTPVIRLTSHPAASGYSEHAPMFFHQTIKYTPEIPLVDSTGKPASETPGATCDSDSKSSLG